ncbi:hypothetical protein [Photobacterium minamisatsumaniensis]|uniref:hypothetical protein n=1 Tax=Photobacterium minamisatsumaniensis TaxID=2910233 RepID=UPI003D10A3BB
MTKNHMLRKVIVLTIPIIFISSFIIPSTELGRKAINLVFIDHRLVSLEFMTVMRNNDKQTFDKLMKNHLNQYGRYGLLDLHILLGRYVFEGYEFSSKDISHIRELCIKGEEVACPLGYVYESGYMYNAKFEPKLNNYDLLYKDTPDHQIYNLPFSDGVSHVLTMIHGVACPARRGVSAECPVTNNVHLVKQINQYYSKNGEKPAHFNYMVN